MKKTETKWIGKLPIADLSFIGPNRPHLVSRILLYLIFDMKWSKQK